MTYPPKEVNSFLIAGFPMPKGAENLTYPPHLKDELKGYRIGIGRFLKSDKKKFHKELVNLLKERTKWVLKLVKKYDPDLFMMNFKEMDEFMHVFWDKKPSFWITLKWQTEVLKRSMR